MDNPDESLGVRFFTKAVPNKKKTEAEGRPIYDDREYVSIIFPGDQKRELVAPAHEAHFVSHAKEQMTYAERFPKFYEAFLDGREDFISGTPIKVLPGVTEARLAELEHLKVRTVEQLAGMAAASLKRLGMGSHDLQERAKSYLEDTKNSALTNELRAEIEALKAQMAGMESPATPQDDDDPFEGMDDEDLKNMIKDSGGKLPSGKVGRAVLIAELQRISEEKEAA